MMSDHIRAKTISPRPSESRLLLWLLGSATSLLTALSIVLYQPSAQAEEFIQLGHPPGQMIAIGTHRLHMYCQGDAAPTILVDAGMGSLALEWKDLQQRLSPFVRVCLYDRAGYGWSDSGTTAPYIPENCQ